MNTRIRYTKLVDGIKQSVQILKAADGKEYLVTISADDKSASVIDATTHVPVKTVHGTNPGATRIAAKEALKELGVQFGNETRTKAGPSIS